MAKQKREIQKTKQANELVENLLADLIKKAKAGKLEDPK